MNPESEFFEPKLLPGERHEPSIRVSAHKLLGLWLRAEVMMTAVDCRRYCDRVVNAVLDIVREFQLSYDFPDDRIDHLKRLWGAVAIYLDLARIVGERNCIRVVCKHEPLTPDQMKLEIFNETSRLDERATKWKRSVLKLSRDKGKTPAAGRLGQSPKE